MKGKSGRHKVAIDELRSENKDLEEQIMALEQLVDSNEYSGSHSVENYIEETTIEEVSDQEYKPPRKKKAKN
ncbi:hypothetical protein EB796_016613 [Bugula neritina]|uniref:Uncharacterized protein n=1 Tax=Bugula neritina TaxID=10212 RepID=A0A7J7JHS3_BUGNE|nr:hypothetical protein EB796_016613 [Bugula neritina]